MIVRVSFRAVSCSARAIGLISALLIGLGAPVLGAQSAMSASRTAYVQEARAVFNAVENDIRQRRLIKHDTTVTCEDGLDARGTSYGDRSGRIRRINTDGGTGDHGESVAIYFDSLGHARFAFAQRGAVNGTQQEERVYFDAHGTVVHRVIRQIRGPGYLFEKVTRTPRIATWIRDLCG
jgi:hypothetical protein